MADIESPAVIFHMVPKVIRDSLRGAASQEGSGQFAGPGAFTAKSAELLMFYLEVDFFKNLQSHDDIVCHSALICQKYIAPTGVSFIGIDADMQSQLLEAAPTNTSPKFFDGVLLHVVETIQKAKTTTAGDKVQRGALESNPNPFNYTPGTGVSPDGTQARTVEPLVEFSDKLLKDMEQLAKQ